MARVNPDKRRVKWNVKSFWSQNRTSNTTTIKTNNKQGVAEGMKPPLSGFLVFWEARDEGERLPTS
jgi:hypothetical protein